MACRPTDDAEERSPEHHADGTVDAVPRRERGADAELCEAGKGERDPVVLREPDVNLVAGEVGSVAAEQRGFGVHGAAGENPAGVGPEGSVDRGVRVAFLVGVLMVDAVGGDPEDRSALERHGAAGGDEVLDPLGGAEAAMREQAMIGDADADVDREEIHDAEGGEVLPREAEQSGDSGDVEDAHDDGGDPVDAAFLVLAAHAEVLLDLLANLLGGGLRLGHGEALQIGLLRGLDLFGGLDSVLLEGGVGGFGDGCGDGFGFFGGEYGRGHRVLRILFLLLRQR